MAIARANGKLKGKPPKLSARQRVHVLNLVQDGDHTIAELAELFAVSRATHLPRDRPSQNPAYRLLIDPFCDQTRLPRAMRESVPQCDQCRGGKEAVPGRGIS